MPRSVYLVISLLLGLGVFALAMPAVASTPPQAFDDVYTTTQGSGLVVRNPAEGVLGNDSGTGLSAAAPRSTPNGTLLLDSDGTFLYVPNPTFVGDDVFSYVATAGTLTDTATVTITVRSVNRPPVADNESYAVDQNGVLSIAAPGVLANDSDPDADLLTATLLQPPAVGTLLLAPSGSFVYTPTLNHSGSVTFTYAATDGALSSVGTVGILIRSIDDNDAPQPSDNRYTMDANGVLFANALTDDTGDGVDHDVNGDVLTVVSVGERSTQHGLVTMSSGGMFFYRPNPDFSGTDVFTYTISDGLVHASARVTITVNVVAPTVVNVTLPTAGWHLVAYPLLDTQTVTNALTTIDGQYTTVWGYDNAAKVWTAHSSAIPELADLTHLQPGSGYWIAVTEAVTIAFSSANGRATALTAIDHTASLPAAFYGAIDEMTVGVPVTAFVGETACAVGTTFRYRGAAYYKLYVVGAVEKPACGQAGAIVTVAVDGVPMAQHGVWQAGEFQRLDLTASAVSAAVIRSVQIQSGATFPFVVMALLAILTALGGRFRPIASQLTAQQTRLRRADPLKDANPKAAPPRLSDGFRSGTSQTGRQTGD